MEEDKQQPENKRAPIPIDEYYPGMLSGLPPQDAKQHRKRNIKRTLLYILEPIFLFFALFFVTFSLWGIPGLIWMLFVLVGICLAGTIACVILSAVNSAKGKVSPLPRKIGLICMMIGLISLFLLRRLTVR